MLAHEEYIEQCYFFQTLGERLLENAATQDLLASIREEILATTKLPLAIDYLLAELKHSGVFAPAIKGLPHYFTSFQAFVVAEAENDRRRFDLRVALQILRREAEYRAGQPTPQGMFLFQFEALCRNRLGYDHGLDAIAGDPIYDAQWKEWIGTVRRQIGMVDLADVIYVRSEHYTQVQARLGKPVDWGDKQPLFGEREGRIALANRRRDPLLFFAALHRQLGYPAVPVPKPVDNSEQLIPQLLRRMERLEQRMKLLEEEQRGGINLERFYKPAAPEELAD